MVEDYGNRARIDHFPEDERHGRVSHQGPFWLVGNFQPFTLAVSFVRPSPGLSLYWSIVAGIAGIAFGTLFMASHATQGPVLGLPQMIQSRAQFGFRGLLLPLIGTLFTLVGFNVVDVVIIKFGAAADLRLESRCGGRGDHGHRGAVGHLRTRPAAQVVPGGTHCHTAGGTQYPAPHGPGPCHAGPPRQPPSQSRVAGFEPA
jgi:Permease for cytosine/purines, uracil, thiamine, allantoin